MNDDKKCFITVWALQEKEINEYCFKQCGKVIFGLVVDEQLGGLSHCYETHCPFLDKEMDEPFGTLASLGTEVYLRKLKDLPEADHD